MTAPGTRQIQNIEKAFKTGGNQIYWQFYQNSHRIGNYTYAEDMNTNNPLPEIALLDFRWNVLADFRQCLGLHYRYSCKTKQNQSYFW